MTLQQLLEQAHLEALGYLDEREQAAFEAAFAAAPPAIRDQVRSEQARVAPMEHLLPAVEPPEHLRSRVLNAVSAAMLAEQAGRGDVGYNGARRVHSAWRAASIGLVSAVVILCGAFFHVFRTNDQINKSFEADAAGTAFLQNFNHQYLGDVLYNSATTRVLMTAVKPTSPATNPELSAKASVWVSPDWKTSRVFCQLPALSAGQSYRVVLVDDNNLITETLKDIEGDGQAKVFEIEHLKSGTKIAIVSVGKNDPSAMGTRVLEAIV